LQDFAISTLQFQKKSSNFAPVLKQIKQEWKLFSGRTDI
jgi:hypothetical protein